jgi:signal transduction histidine kinase
MVALEAIPLFRQLNRTELQVLRLITQERRFAAGEEIFHEGAPGDGVYFVKSGSVEISAGINEQRIFSRLGPGEIFGEMAVIEHRPRSATVSATEDTEVYFLPRGEMLGVIDRSPALALTLLQQISHRLRDLSQLYLHEIIEAERLAVVGNFARSIIHDLKTPLSIISLSAEMCGLAGINPENCNQSKQRIFKQVNRINDMVGDILIFTQGAQKEAVLQPGDYRAFVLELIGDLRSEAELKSAQIELENQPPPVTVLFDPRRLTRVFFNLIHNATDAMLNGGKIMLRFHLNENEITTEIEDSGLGIAPEIADSLFQPFTTHGKSYGTGLGLSICKKIVEDHGGTIEAHSEAGRGAIFRFTLPVAK